MKVAGIDEAGRGALAGPIVAGCVLDVETLKEQKYIQDSKQLTDSQRREAFEWIKEHCVWGVGIVDAIEIDQIGIRKANEKAMNIALSSLSVQPEKVLVDGRDKFVFPIPSIDIIKGDEKELCISAASIIAKVTRDDLMIAYDRQYPEFGFASHKGYGSESHRELLDQGICCDIHRKSYDPLKTVLTQGKLF